ncbi:pPIWI_RE module domain-containing protein [Streptomyces murinus]|uniref:pPIWI_RE module domain-containing protein n=1 Tax=Streptomyces murinus TaxID=33900 RepID=UPI003F47C1DA
MRYETIRLVRYAPAPEADWTVSYYTLALPEFHRGRILRLYRRGLRNPDSCRSMPVGRLNSLLQALAPEVLSVAKWLDVTREEPWLYARSPVPRDVLTALLTTWVKDLRPEREYRQEVRETLRELRFGALRWEKQTVPLLSRDTTASGTADPADRLYQLLPDALAERVLGLPEPFTYPGGSLTFRGVARRPGDRGAELLSWPPDRHIDRDGQTWWFSARLTVTLQTAPFSPDFFVHVQSGVRRWATRMGQNGLYLPPRRAASVYLLTDAPWLGNDSESRPSARFSVSRLRYDRKLRAQNWENGGPEGMLARLHLSQPLPEPGKLLRNPEDWLNRPNGLTAAVVHSTAMGAHGVKPGLMPGDRVPLMRWFEQALPEGLVRVPDHVRADRYLPARRRPQKGRSPADRMAEEIATLRREVADVLEGEPLRLEFLWLTEPNRDAGVQALRTVLGLPKQSEAVEPDDAAGRNGEIRSWRTPELVVELHLTRVGELADGLPLPVDGRMRTSALRAAISGRRDQVVRQLPKTAADGRVTLALVEIHQKKAYTPRSTDPKFALRLGFRDAGRVTQFATNAQQVTRSRAKADEARSKKFESCWTDGLRQLGHRAVPDHRLGEAIPPNTQYAALWLVRRRRDGPTRQADLVPIAVRVRPDATAAERITGWDHRSGVWVPYPELLLRLAESAELPTVDITEEFPEGDAEEASGPEETKEDSFDLVMEPDGRTERHRRAVASTVQELLYGLRDRPTLLLVHAQNTRQLWPWLQNARIQPDVIQLHGQPAQGIALQGPGLRVIRIRDHAGTETPQWWGHGTITRDDGDAEEEAFGLPAGLWKPHGSAPRHRVFGSTSEKAGPGATVAKNASRWALRPSTREGKTVMTIDTDKLAWNPALLEITVAACRTEDDPELWATLAHRLRQSPGRAPLLALPLPLVLASKAAEYVLPTTQDQSSEPDEDDGVVQLSFDLGAIAE